MKLHRWQWYGISLLVVLLLVAVPIAGWWLFQGESAAPEVLWRASIVVCASDSCGAEGCDYECDGTDDQDDFNAAVAELEACGVGGEILATEGNFYLTDSIVVSDNIKLRGSGWGTVFNAADGAYAAIENATQSGDGNTGIILESFAIDGVDTALSYGVYLKQVSASAVKDLHISDFDAGVYVGTGDSIEVGGCTLQSCASGFVASTITDSQLSNNFITSNTGNGGYFTTATRCALAGNTVSLNGGNGLYFSGGSGNSIARNVISKNSATVAGTHAVAMAGSYSSIVANVIIDNYQNGVTVAFSDHNTVSNNVVSNSSQLTDNTYNNVYVIIANYTTVSGNHVRKSGNSPRAKYGLNDAGSLTMIHGNNFYLGGQTAAVFDGSANERIRDNVALDGTWMADNEGFTYEPTQNYEVAVVDSEVLFATHYYDFRMADPLGTFERGQWDTTLHIQAVDLAAGQFRFVIFDLVTEWPRIAAMLKALDEKADVKGAKEYIKPGTTAWSDAGLRTSLAELNGRCATRSQAAYYIEHPEDRPVTMEDMKEYVKEAMP